MFSTPETERYRGEVWHLAATGSAFAALRADGHVVLRAADCHVRSRAVQGFTTGQLWGLMRASRVYSGALLEF